MSKPFLIFSDDSALAESLRSTVAAIYPSTVVFPIHAVDSIVASSLQPIGAILHADLLSTAPFEQIARIRALLKNGPFYVYPSRSTPEYTKEARKSGATSVEALPVQHDVLRQNLSRLVETGGSPALAPTLPPSASTPPFSAAGRGFENRSLLEIVRTCSTLLSAASSRDVLLDRFAKVLRDTLGISALAIYLNDRRATDAFPDSSARPTAYNLSFQQDIDPLMAKCIRLREGAGVPGWLARHRRVLAAQDADGVAQAEMVTLGASYALPLVGHGVMMGVIFVGDRVAGRCLDSDELTLLYHVSGELALSLSSVFLNEQLSFRADLMRSMTESVDSGTVLIDHDMQVLVANPAAMRLLQLDRSELPAFGELPKWLCSALFACVKGQETEEAFIEDSQGRYLRYSARKMTLGSNSPSAGAMATIEDHTAIRAAKLDAMSTERSRITSTIAERLAHEILNTVSPLAVIEELLPERIGEVEFQEHVRSSLALHNIRITRFSHQLSYLTGSRSSPEKECILSDLLGIAAASACKYMQLDPDKSVSINIPNVLVFCDRNALICAFHELILNGLQSKSSTPHIAVTAKVIGDTVEVCFTDSGPGFAPSSVHHAKEPFYTERAVGVGLGLSVAEKVAQSAGGDIAIFARTTKNSPDVVMTLPALISR